MPREKKGNKEEDVERNRGGRRDGKRREREREGRERGKIEGTGESEGNKRRKCWESLLQDTALALLGPYLAGEKVGPSC